MNDIMRRAERSMGLAEEAHKRRDRCFEILDELQEEGISKEQFKRFVDEYNLIAFVHNSIRHL